MASMGLQKPYAKTKVSESCVSMMFIGLQMVVDNEIKNAWNTFPGSE
jgi:hypothetical protein